MRKSVRLACLTLVGAFAAFSAHVNASSAQTPDVCTESHFGYFFLKGYSNNYPVVLHRDLFDLSSEVNVQVIILATAGYQGGGTLTFGKADGSTEVVEVVPGATIVKSAKSLVADLSGPHASQTYFNGRYRFL